jgi:hypothetical protein
MLLMSEVKTLCAFHLLGPVALGLFSDISSARVAARKEEFGDLGRRIDETLLTDNFDRYWNVRTQGEERERQARLLEKVRRQRRAMAGGKASGVAPTRYPRR